MPSHLRKNIEDLIAAFVERHRTPAFDSHYMEKADSHARRPASRAEQELVIEWLKPRAPRRVLDFGCNLGRPLDVVCRGLEAEGTGVDINRAAIKNARAERSQYRFQEIDGTHIPFQNDTFDHVMVHHVLGHIESPLSKLSEICRVLRPGGTLSVVTANARYKRWQFPLNALSGFQPDVTVRRYFTEPLLRQTLEAAGLHVELSTTSGDAPTWCPRTLSGARRLFLVALAVKPPLDDISRRGATVVSTPNSSSATPYSLSLHWLPVHAP